MLQKKKKTFVEKVGNGCSEGSFRRNCYEEKLGGNGGRKGWWKVRKRQEGRFGEVSKKSSEQTFKRNLNIITHRDAHTDLLQ